MIFLLELFLATYFLYITSYVVFFSLGGFLYQRLTLSMKTRNRNYLILIPGYKEDEVIFEAVKKNLSIEFDKSSYHVLVIADSFQPSTLDQLAKLDCEVLEVQFEESTKVKSLQRAVSHISGQYDQVIILDADNIMEKDYLMKVDSFLDEKGSKAIQTQRVPKNQNNRLAILDGISEAINNHIYRQGASATGFSAALNGSGMVFDLSLFTSIILKMNSVGGFDRELEYQLLEKGVKVKYLKEACIYDEKTDDHKNFQNQRKRWISSQYVYLFKYFGSGLKRLLFKGDLVYFHSTVWRNIQLPRLINLGLFTICILVLFPFKDSLVIPFAFWFTLWASYISATLICVPGKYLNGKLFFTLLLLPKILVTMLQLMFNLKGANKRFIHTSHKAK
ncbi:MAG: glycosyltransferase family 2 protein [Ekhidna sp.]